MKPTMSCLFVLLLSLCDSVGSSLPLQLTSECNLQMKPLSDCSKRAKLFVRKLSELLLQLTEAIGLHLTILYDQENTDVAESVTVSSSLEFRFQSVFKYDGTNQTIHQMLTSAVTGSLIVSLCSPEHSVNLFRIIHQQRFDYSSSSWLLVSRNHNSTELILNGIEGLILEGTSVMILTDTLDDSYSLQSANVENRDSYLSSFKLGDDRHRDSISLFNHLGPYQKNARDLSGLEMKVATNDFVGFFELSPENPPSGVDVEIVKALSRTLNFTYRVVHPLDGLWGNPLPDGTVTGLIGMASRREADFAICAIGVTSTRETVVDFTYPYYREPLAIFTRAPKQKNRALAILSPFALQAWIGIILSASLIGVILKMESKITSSIKRNNFDWDLQSYSFNMFRSLVIQGNRLKSYHWPQRLIFFTWYIFCLIISALYSGMLTAVLAIPAYETPVNSLSDLPRAVEEGFTISILKASSNAALFKEAKDGIYKDTWELFDHENPAESFVDRPETGIQRVLMGKYLFIGFKISNEILVTQIGKQKFHVARDTFYPQSIGIACPPGSPYKDSFSELLMLMGEGGLISKWFQNEINKFSGKSSDDNSDVNSSAITITHLQAAFFLILLGSTIAGGTFLAENLVTRC